MTVEFITSDDIFASGASAIVVPVNAIGVPGKGLALAAAKRWPEWASLYRAECRQGIIEPGGLYCHTSLDASHRPPIWPLSGVVKNHWRDPSRIEWVESVLRKVVAYMLGAGGKAGRYSVAVPALGCGLGGLAWADVRPLAEQILGQLPGRVMLYAPRGGRPAR